MYAMAEGLHPVPQPFPLLAAVIMVVATICGLAAGIGVSAAVVAGCFCLNPTMFLTLKLLPQNFHIMSFMLMASASCLAGANLNKAARGKREYLALDHEYGATALKREAGRLRQRAAHSEHLGRTGSWDFEPASGQLSLSEGVYRILDLPLNLEIDLDQTLTFADEDRRAAIRAAIYKAGEQNKPFDQEIPFTSKNGRRGWLHSLGYPEIDEFGVQHIVGIVRDVTPEVTTEKQLRHFAERDCLTDVWNRRMFLARLESTITAAESSGGLAIAVFDIDSFKEVNDVHGHDIGDILLIEFARRLAAGARATDAVARLGGDEFAMILPGLSATSAVSRRMEMILGLFERPFDTPAGPLAIGTSIGTTVHSTGYVSPAILLKQADVALYRAKSLGRGQACAYSVNWNR
jgi:diguanylate cyclase (GGDEF)-like protein